MDFEWSEGKNAENIAKHELSFYIAQEVFFDGSRVILLDKKHSSMGKRYFCIGKTTDGDTVTVDLL
jgi:uncharacterized DUF497 family protein